MWSYDEMENKVRTMTKSLPPSDLNSTRSIQAITKFAFDLLKEHADARQQRRRPGDYLPDDQPDKRSRVGPPPKRQARTKIIG